MPFGKRGTKTPAQRAKYDTTMRRMRNARAARLRASRGIKVSTGVGRNGFSRTVGSGYKPKSKFARKVQKVVFETVEKKYRSGTINGPEGTNIQLSSSVWNHNSLNYISLWNSVLGTNSAGTRLFPTQGLTDGNRIGDEIYATGIMLRLMINLAPDRRTTNIKAWFVPWNTSQGSPLLKNEFFHGLVDNVMIDKLQTDRWPGTRYLGLFRNSDPDNITSTAHGQIYMRVWIPLNRKITFITDGDTIVARGLKEVGSLVFATYDKINSSTLDNCVTSVQGEATLHYKDP